MIVPSMFYTKTDEAADLATNSLFRIFRAYLAAAGVDLRLTDISVANRVLAQFQEYLTDDQRALFSDDFGLLGRLTEERHANIIKVPNVSADLPQLKRTIKELQTAGFAVPDYPDEPTCDEEAEVKRRYELVRGSAVNPVLRKHGNTVRRIHPLAKAGARKKPRTWARWTSSNPSAVVSMPEADFYGNEVSWTSESDTTLSIILIADDGSHTVLADGIQVERNEIVDTTFLSVCRLQAFLKESLAEAKRNGLVWTIHLKATMMKRSDPVIFGHAVRVFFEEVFTKYGDTLKDAGANPNNGLQDIISAVEAYPINLALREHKAALQIAGIGLEESPNFSIEDLRNAIDEIKHTETKEQLREIVNSALAKRDEILEAIEKAIEDGPSLGMVDSKKGITNLHSPAGTIIDASMPRLLCNGGWWDADDEVRPALAVIPDRTFADLYQGNLADLKKNDAFLPAKMGSVTTVRLTAYKAEEYGSHETTYEIGKSGTVIVIDGNAKLLSSHRVQAGDVWRMCRVKEAAYKDWVSLAVKTASETGDPTVFWLDENRPHDEQLAVKVREYLNDLDVSGLNIEIMNPLDAVAFTNARIRKGFNVTCVVGNVRGDHNTDIYPIFELGTSAAMESLLYLVTGGIVCETGSAGTCPDHVKQLLEENYLRWIRWASFWQWSPRLRT